MAGLGAVLFAAAIGLWAPVIDGPPIPIWLLVPAFVGTNLLVVHVEVRGDAQTLCLVELPLVAGLLLAGPAEVIAARVVAGALVALVLDRQSGLKASFNIALSWYSTALVLAVFTAITSVSTSIPVVALAVYVAVIAGAVTDTLCISRVIGLAGGPMTGAAKRKVMAFGILNSAVMASLALLAVAAATVTLWTVVSVVVVTATLYGGFRLYATVSERYAQLQQLHELTQMLTRSPEFGSASRAILDEGRELLRCARAELCLTTADSAVVMRMTLDEQSAFGIETVADHATDPLSKRVLASGEPIVIGRDARTEEQREMLEVRRAKDLAVVPLFRGESVIGTISMLDRLGDVSTFDTEDLRVLGTFGNHASMALENVRLIDELHREAEDKRYQATHDALTGLANRTMLTEVTVDALSRAIVSDGHVAMLLMDLDRFKEINDTLGHHHGDLLLQEVAQRLRGAAPQGATVARLGGDEFSILLREVQGPDGAVAVARDISTVFERPYIVEGLQLTVSTSIGVAVSPEHGTDVADLLRHADIAMYEAKTRHATVQLYDDEHDHNSARRIALAGALRTAVEQGNLGVHYQPKGSLATGEIVGVEALCRWTHEEFGTVSPVEFIPIAEHVGLMKPLTLFMLERGLKQLQGWSGVGMDLTLAVNLSVQSLLDVALPDDVTGLLAKYEIAPERLTLEITESEIMRDPERTMAVLFKLRDVGVQLSIDDFGTGHSSLAYLKELPVDEVKIDRAFVAQVATNDIDATIVKSIVEVARNRGLKVVAEGIEDRITWEVLFELGCDIAQGYYLARPADGGATTMWLMQRQSSAQPAPAGDHAVSKA